MDLNALLYAGILIVTGLLFGKIAKYAKLPNVTGYLVGGLLIGPSILGLVSGDAIETMEIVSNVALGFIAFSIGNELKISYFKQMGTRPIVIAILEALFGVVFVFVAVILYFLITGQLDLTNIRFALVLAAIAAATAPMQILAPFWEIILSIGIGGIFGIIVTFAVRWFTGRGNRISLVIAAVFLTLYLTTYLNGSALLACMALGAVFANTSNKYDEVNGLINYITPPIFIMFFVLSGAELNLSLLLKVGIIGIIYILSRVAGKIFGSWFGAKVTHADPKIQKYLGYALIPQAGVAIGLSLIATQVLNPEMGSQIRTIILVATLIYELIGPIVTKKALQAAGEIELNR
ncbi:MAG: cation/H(+) antiporter [Tenericutes bacterium HGW-Tenericutes-1]|nr:MAG: cation/H(+) antiporter [Tenericutes bacterium HGW-Tenericutes-1]